MEFRLLGDVTAVTGGQQIELGRRQERLLLGILLLEVNRVVPTDRLIELLWGGEPPAKPKRALQVYYSRLRQALSAAGGPLLAREGDGYLLKTAAESVDLHHFSALVETARSIEDPADRASRLRSALDLWQGPPLAGVATAELHNRLCAPLEEAHRVALELRIDAELAAGRHHELLPELNVLVAEFPTRERLVGAKMLALHRVDRSGEALVAYQDLAARLLKESGLDPGPQLQSLAAAIQERSPALTGGPAEANLSADRPRQLPPDVRLLVDRDLLLAYGEAHLTKQATAAAVFCLYGGAGVGKSAAAVRLGHRIAADFPAGQLFVRLVEPDGRPLPAATALGRLLRGLGADEIPDSLEDRSAALKELAKGKEILLVLDDAQHLAQVLPLLQLGPGGAVIITSRQPLTGLQPAVHREVLSLGQDASLDLLRHVSGLEFDRHLTAELVTIIEYCAGLPLALRVIGSRLQPAGGWSVPDTVEALGDAVRRLDVLEIGDRAVRSSLDLTLAAAPSSTRTLLERLADLQLAEFSSWVAAALSTVDESTAERECEQLADLGLIQVVTEQPRRFGMHDLIRTYAVDRGSADPERTAASRRYLDALVRLTTIADGELDHGFVQTEGLGMPASPELRSIELAVMADADGWFRREVTGICAAVTLAAAADLPDVSALLALRVRGFLTLEDDYVVAVETLRTAIQAVEGRELAGLHARLLQAYFTTIAQHGESIEELAPLAERSLRLAQEDASPLLEMAAYWQVGYAAIEACDFVTAAAAYESALRIIEKNQDLEVHRAKALSGTGDAVRLAGDPNRAVETLLAAVELDPTRSRWRAVTLFDLASALVQAGRLDEAMPVIREAGGIFDELGDVFGKAYVDVVDARRVLRAGSWDEARALLDSSIGYFLSIDDRTSLYEARVAEAELLVARGKEAEARVVLTTTEVEATQYRDQRSAYQCRQLLATIEA